MEAQKIFNSITNSFLFNALLCTFIFFMLYHPMFFVFLIPFRLLAYFMIFFLIIYKFHKKNDRAFFLILLTSLTMIGEGISYLSIFNLAMSKHEFSTILNFYYKNLYQDLFLVYKVIIAYVLIQIIFNKRGDL